MKMPDIVELDGTLSPSAGYTPEQWSTALRVLNDLLRAKGSTSSIAVTRELKRNEIVDSRPLVLALIYMDREELPARGLEVPSFAFYHLGRSFYTEERYREELAQLEAETEREADNASRSVAVVEAPEEAPPPRVYRQDEARLTAYVKRALDDLYANDRSSEDCAYVFDVHSERAGSSFENVDVLAVHWRSSTIVDIVTVEVKLDFVPQVVQQALNYLRFSNRVWIAVPVSSDPDQAGRELRDRDPQLFDYVVSRGLGILACHRRKGRSYDVFPIHWPVWHNSDPLERELFVERYRSRLEEAGVIERKKKQFFPALR